MSFEKKTRKDVSHGFFVARKMEIQLSKPIGVSLLAEIEVRKSPGFEPRTRFLFNTFCGKWGLYKGQNHPSVNMKGMIMWSATQMFHILRDVWCIQKILGSVVQPWYTVVKSSSLLYGLKYKFEPSWHPLVFQWRKPLQGLQGGVTFIPISLQNRGSGGGNKRPHKRKVKEDKFESHDA